MDSTYESLEKEEDVSTEDLFRAMYSIDMLGVDNTSNSEQQGIIYEDGDGLESELEESQYNAEPLQNGNSSEADSLYSTVPEKREGLPIKNTTEKQSKVARSKRKKRKAMNTAAKLGKIRLSGNIESDIEEFRDFNSPSNEATYNAKSVFKAESKSQEGSKVVNNRTCSDSDVDVEDTSINTDTNKTSIYSTKERLTRIDNLTRETNSDSYQICANESDIDVHREQKSIKNVGTKMTNEQERVLKPLTIRLKPISSKQKIYSSSDEESEEERSSLVINEDNVVNDPPPVLLEDSAKNVLDGKNPLALLSEGDISDSEGAISGNEGTTEATAKCEHCLEELDQNQTKAHRCCELEKKLSDFWVCTVCQDTFPSEEATMKHCSINEHTRCVFCRKIVSIRVEAALRHVDKCSQFLNTCKKKKHRHQQQDKTVSSINARCNSMQDKTVSSINTRHNSMQDKTASTPASGSATKLMTIDLQKRSGKKRWNRSGWLAWRNNCCVVCGMAGFDTYVSRFLHFKEFHHKNICVECGAIYNTAHPLIIHMKKVHGKTEHEHSELDLTKKYESDVLILCVDCNQILKFADLKSHFCKPAYGKAKAQLAPSKTELLQQVTAEEKQPTAKQAPQNPPTPTVSEKRFRNKRWKRRPSESEISVDSDHIAYDDSEPESKTRFRKKSTKSLEHAKSGSPVESPKVSESSMLPSLLPSLEPPDIPADRETTPFSSESESELEAPAPSNLEALSAESTLIPVSPVPHEPVNWREKLDTLLYKLVLRLRKMLSLMQETGCNKCLSYETSPSSIEELFSHLKNSHDLFLLRGLGVDTEKLLFNEVNRIYMQDIPQSETRELGEENMSKPFCANVNKEYACTICNSNKMPFFNFVNHLRIAHSFRYYPCVECGKRFRSYGLLLSHLRDTTGETIFGCRICKVSGIQNIFILQSHIRAHSICDRCFRGFDGQLSLKNHLYAHQKDQPFVCTACDKSYKTSESLEMHLLWKHGTEGKHCPKCQNKIWECTYHFCPGSPIDEHYDENLNKCGLCQVEFQTPEMLRIHNRLHSGARPHKCTLCERAFISKKLLLKHREIAHEQDIHNLDKVGAVNRKQAMEILKKIGLENQDTVKESDIEVTEKGDIIVTPVPQRGKSLFDIDENEESPPPPHIPTPPPASPPKAKESIIPYFYLEHDYCKPYDLPEVRLKPKKPKNAFDLKLPKVHLSSSSSEGGSSDSESSSETESDSSSPENELSPKKLDSGAKKDKSPIEITANFGKEVNVEDSQSSESETDSIASEPDLSIHESDLVSEESETENKLQSFDKERKSISPIKIQTNQTQTVNKKIVSKKSGGLKILLPKHLQKQNGKIRTLSPMNAPGSNFGPKQYQKKKGLKVLQPKVTEYSSDDLSSGEEQKKVVQGKRKQKLSKLSPSLPPVKKVKSLPSEAPEPINNVQTTGKLYCYCRCPYDEVSQMIGCDASDCPYEWFHFECVGIMIPPEGRWYCPDCRLKPKYQGKST